MTTNGCPDKKKVELVWTNQEKRLKQHMSKVVTISVYYGALRFSYSLYCFKFTTEQI